MVCARLSCARKEPTTYCAKCCITPYCSEGCRQADRAAHSDSGVCEAAGLGALAAALELAVTVAENLEQVPLDMIPFAEDRAKYTLAIYQEALAALVHVEVPAGAEWSAYELSVAINRDLGEPHAAASGREEVRRLGDRALRKARAYVDGAAGSAAMVVVVDKDAGGMAKPPAAVVSPMTVCVRDLLARPALTEAEPESEAEAKAKAKDSGGDSTLTLTFKRAAAERLMSAHDVDAKMLGFGTFVDCRAAIQKTNEKLTRARKRILE